MSKTKIELSDAGIQELLKSDEIEEVLMSYATGIQNRCSGNYEVSSQKGKYRTKVRVASSDKKTYFKNLQTNELLKALR